MMPGMSGGGVLVSGAVNCGVAGVAAKRLTTEDGQQQVDEEVGTAAAVGSR
jgi:hypothetical protein